MVTRGRLVTVGVVGALGVVAAVAVAAGQDNVKACVIKKSGELRATTPGGKCRASQFAITIAGDAFKRSRGGTLTINGVAFKRTGTLPNSITINGTSFRSSGKTLTINGTEFAPGAAVVRGPTGTSGPIGVAGPAGETGKIGPTGPPGIPYGPPPVEAAGPVHGTAGASTPATLAELTFSNSDGQPHRLLVAGGFNLVCNPCAPTLQSSWSLARSGAADPLVERDLPAMSGSDKGSSTVSEIVVTPSVCGPCTFSLRLDVGAGSGGGAEGIDATRIRAGILDLGPVTP